MIHHTAPKKWHSFLGELLYKIVFMLHTVMLANTKLVGVFVLVITTGSNAKWGVFFVGNILRAHLLINHVPGSTFMAIFSTIPSQVRAKNLQCRWKEALCLLRSRLPGFLFIIEMLSSVWQTPWRRRVGSLYWLRSVQHKYRVNSSRSVVHSTCK